MRDATKTYLLFSVDVNPSIKCISRLSIQQIQYNDAEANQSNQFSKLFLFQNASSHFNQFQQQLTMLSTSIQCTAHQSNYCITYYRIYDHRIDPISPVRQHFNYDTKKFKQDHDAHAYPCSCISKSQKSDFKKLNDFIVQISCVGSHMNLCDTQIN